MSTIFPRAKGTVMVIADEIIKQPIPTEMNKKMIQALFGRNQTTDNLQVIFHFSDFASDNNLLTSVNLNLIFSGLATRFSLLFLNRFSNKLKLLLQFIWYLVELSLLVKLE